MIQVIKSLRILMAQGKRSDHLLHTGFTVTELLVVLLVIGILATIAIPSFHNMLTTGRVQSAGEGIYKMIMLARSNAIQRNASVYFVYQTGSNWCYGANTGSTCNCNTSNSCNLGSESYTTTTGVTLSATGFTNNQIIFSGVRAFASSVGAFTFAAGDKSLVIGVNLVGAPTLCGNNMTGRYTAC